MSTTSEPYPGQLFIPVAFEQLDGGDLAFEVSSEWQMPTSAAAGIVQSSCLSDSRAKTGGASRVRSCRLWRQRGADPHHRGAR